MNSSPIIIPTVAKGFVSHQTNLGVANYNLDDLYSPDTGMWQSKVLDLATPKYSPNKTYWFDKSRYCNHGTISGATWVRNSKGVWVLSFDGISNIITGWGSAKILALTYPLTFELWVNFNTIVQGAILLSLDVTDANSDIAFGLNNGGGKNLIHIGRDTYPYGMTNATSILTAGLWYHWVVVFTDTTHIYFYLNGVLQTLTDIADWFGVSGCAIGARVGLAFLNGKIGKVIIYNQALTGVKIQQNYLTTKWRYQ